MINPTEASQTEHNLQTAFAGESMANRKYLYFAKIARSLGDEEVAKLFEDTAHEETGHAFAHLELIYPKEKMTVERLLELAVEGERYEHTTMYPEFEAKACDEANAKAVAQFREQAEECRAHDARFAAMLEKARRRFAALIKVEKLHADRYQDALDKRQGGAK